MQIESTFSVVAPIDEVWETLMDFEKVASCVPGAEILNKLSDDAYQVGMKVKVGPITMQYRGQMTVMERDAVAHKAVFEGRAQEARGQGTAQGSATMILVESEGTTQGSVTADVDLSGKVAAMGKGIIGGVTDQMMALFAQNLQTMLSESGTPSPEPEPTGETADAESPSAAQPRAHKPMQAAPVRATPASPAHATPANTSLNAFDLVMGMFNDQLTKPGRVFGAVAVIAFVSFRLGRRVGERRTSR